MKQMKFNTKSEQNLLGFYIFFSMAIFVNLINVNELFGTENQRLNNQKTEYIILQRLAHNIPNFNEAFSKNRQQIENDAKYQRQTVAFNTPNNQPKIMAAVFSTFNTEILNQIFIFDSVKNIHTIIRTLLDIEQSNEKFELSGQNRERFFQRLNRSFYYSRRILMSGLSNKLVELFFEDNNITEQVNVTRYFYDADNLVNIFEFNNRFVATLTKKAGAQFGSKVTIVDNIGVIPQSVYFTKSYFGYPATNDKNTEEIINMTTTYRTDGMHSANIYDRLNWKELFIYKVLEALKLGAKISFAINPVINDGLFIVSKDLNDPALNLSFREIKDFFRITESQQEQEFISNAFIKKVIKLRGAPLEEHEGNGFQNNNLIIDLTELDLIARIFKLSDFNEGNFGYIHRTSEDFYLKPQKFETKEEQKTRIQKILIAEWSKSRQFSIIDFLTPDALISLKEENEGIYDDFDYCVSEDELTKHFLKGNGTTGFKSNGLVSRVLTRLNVDTVEGKELNELFEKLYYGRLAFEKIQERISVLNIQTRQVKQEHNIDQDYVEILTNFLEQKKEELNKLLLQNIATPTGNKVIYRLLNFKSRNDPDVPERQNDHLKPKTYIEDAIEDLEKYIQSIIKKYIIFKNLLTIEKNESEISYLLDLTQQF